MAGIVVNILNISNRHSETYTYPISRTTIIAAFTIRHMRDRRIFVPNNDTNITFPLNSLKVTREDTIDT